LRHIVFTTKDTKSTKKIKKCRTNTLGSFEPVRYFKRFPFFVSFMLFVAKYPSACSLMIQVCFTEMNQNYYRSSYNLITLDISLGTVQVGL
jgi:hypothetical protein